ncbi:MAG TPA: hypothetical protein VMH22_09580 [bacterium]|nr:hypothetical protein [bacterium]
MNTQADRSWHTSYVLILGLVFAASVALTLVSLKYGDNKVLILSDGKGYYVWARSIILDHDIDFRNDNRLVHESDGFQLDSVTLTPAGHPANKLPIGVAILEVPGVLIGHVMARYVTHSPTNGWSTPYQVAVAWSLMVFYFVSFLLLYRAMLSLGVAEVWAFGFCLTALVGTNLIHYVSKEMTMAHGAGVAVFNILLFLIVRWVRASERTRAVRGVLLGGLVGLLFLIRNTNALLLPVLVAIVWHRKRVSLRESVPMLAGAAATVSLQPVSLWFLWGQIRFSTYYNEYFTAGIAGILNALISVRNGLFVYSPWYAILILLAAYSAICMPRTRYICAAAVASFLLTAVVNGTWWCWWFGQSYGNRAFVELLPALSLAAALTVSHQNVGRRAKAALVVAMLAVTAMNLYLWMGCLLQALPSDGNHTIGQVYLWPLSHSVRSLIDRLAH